MGHNRINGRNGRGNDLPPQVKAAIMSQINGGQLLGQQQQLPDEVATIQAINNFRQAVEFQEKEARELLELLNKKRMAGEPHDVDMHKGIEVYHQAMVKALDELVPIHQKALLRVAQRSIQGCEKMLAELRAKVG